MSEPDSLTEIAEEVASRVVELLEQRPLLSPWLTPTEVAKLLSVDRAYVYEHAADLGARRLGDGPKGRLRFRHEDVLEAIPCLPGRKSEVPATRTAKPKQRRRAGARLGTNAPLLPIRGQQRAS